jgi:pimeloyl-ACP methyl ester carboxylesterase
MQTDIVRAIAVVSAMIAVLYTFSTSPFKSWNYTLAHDITTIDALEQTMLCDIYNCSEVKSRWFNDSVDSFHIIQAGNASLPHLVLIHGYGATSAISWRNVIPRIQDKFHVFALNLPGFGRTSLPHHLNLNDMNESNVLDMYCAYFNTVWKELGIQSPYVVAHSFGGFIFTHCAAKKPDLASSLLLADVPGFFPTNGGMDFYIAALISAGMPHRLLKAAGVWGKYMVSRAVSAVDLSLPVTLIEYWHSVQVSSAMQSESVMRYFVKHYYFYAIGSGLALSPFLNLKMPVAIVYGSKDTLSPPHQGEILRDLTGVKLFVIEGADHMPYNFNRGQDFSQVRITNGVYTILALLSYSQVLMDALMQATPLHPFSPSLAQCLDDSKALWAEHWCFPIPILSDLSLLKVYASIRKVRDTCILLESTVSSRYSVAVVPIVDLPSISADHIVCTN